MKASELRVNNWVHDPVYNKMDFQIEMFLGLENFQPLCLDPNEELTLSLLECKPILLNDIWLLKFGFIPSGEGYKLKNYMLCDFTLSGYSMYEWDSYNEVEVCIKNNIRYVHQLQNLYHSLTDEEI